MDCPITLKMVLDEDEETKEPMVQVHKKLVTKLKPHQVEGETPDMLTISR
jgi:transcriptional regulator ATRX